MRVKEWLKNGRKLNFEIRALKEARDKALNAAVGGAVNYSAEKVQVSNENGKERCFVNYSQYAADLDVRIKELEYYRMEMLSLINKVDNSTYRTLLIEYYINCKSWEQVAEFIGYEVRYTQKLHGLALRECDIILKKT